MLLIEESIVEFEIKTPLEIARDVGGTRFKNNNRPVKPPFVNVWRTTGTKPESSYRTELEKYFYLSFHPSTDTKKIFMQIIARVNTRGSKEMEPFKKIKTFGRFSFDIQSYE